MKFMGLQSFFLKHLAPFTNILPSHGSMNCTSPRVSCVNCRSECYCLGSCTSPSCHTRVMAMSQLQEVKEKTLIPAWPGKPARGGRRYHLLPWEALLPKHTGTRRSRSHPVRGFPSANTPRHTSRLFSGLPYPPHQGTTSGPSHGSC